MGLLNVEVIDNINAQIEGVIAYADNKTEVINQKIAGNTANAQEIINTEMDKLGEKITEKGNDIRDKAVDVLRAQYQTALEMIEPIEPLLNVSLSMDTIVSVVRSIIGIITAPYQPIIDFTTEVIPKVQELGTNLQELATYQPNINAPEGVGVPSISINIEPITPADITGGQ